MRAFLLRSLIALLAVALIASGATAQQCFAATAHQRASAVPEASPLSAHAEHAMHVSHHTHQNGSTPEKHDHSGLNCCTMCTTPTVLASSPLRDIVFSVAAIDFPLAPHGITGHIVLVDPGIPKTSV